jgi:hypothetical protein
VAQPRQTPRQRRARLRHLPGRRAAGRSPGGYFGARAVWAGVRDLHPALRGGRRARRTSGCRQASADIEDITRLIHYSSYWRNGPVLNNALSGVDQALWDNAGKRAGLPVYELLGGRSRSAVEVYSHAAGATIPETLDRAEELIAAGYRHIRLQLGGPGIGTYGAPATRGGYLRSPNPTAGTCSTTSRARTNFSPRPASASAPRSASCTMCTAASPKQAIALARALEPYRLSFLEDMIAPEHYDLADRPGELALIQAVVPRMDIPPLLESLAPPARPTPPGSVEPSRAARLPIID